MAYLKDVLTKLPARPNSRIAELLPHDWVAAFERAPQFAARPSTSA